MTLRAYVLVSLGAIAALIVILRQVRLRRLRAKYALIWMMAGGALCALGVIPGALDWLARMAGVAYPPALLLVLGLGFFALLSLHFSVEMSRLEERTRVLAEEAALLREAQERLGGQRPPDRDGSTGLPDGQRRREASG